MIWRAFILSILISSENTFCQLDTLLISARIKGLTTLEDHKKFWKDIYDKDQHYRGKLTRLEIDDENLVTVSYYLNRFGYPNSKILGKESSIILMVWIHNRSTSIDKLTFPLVLEGLKAKEIDDKNFREYYLLSVYQSSYDDDDYKDKPFPIIFKRLGVNISNSINIEKLVSSIDEYHKFCKEPKEIIGLWKESDGKYTINFKGEPLHYSIPGSKVIIYKHFDGRLFIEILYPDQSYDPLELKIKNKDPFQFEFKNKHTTSYYEINNNGSLYFKDGNGKVVNEYKKFADK